MSASKRLIRCFFQIVVPAMLLGIGVYNIMELSGYEPFLAQRSVFYIQGVDVQAWAWWLTAVLGPLVLAGLAVRSALSREYLRLKTSSGHALCIRKAAVERYVSDHLDGFDFIRSVRVDCGVKGGGLDLVVHLTVESDRPLAELQSEVLETLAERIKQGLGVKKIVGPQLIFRDIRLKKNKARKKEENLAAVGMEEGADSTGLPLLASQNEGASEEQDREGEEKREEL